MLKLSSSHSGSLYSEGSNTGRVKKKNTMLMENCWNDNMFNLMLQFSDILLEA